MQTQARQHMDAQGVDASLTPSTADLTAGVRQAITVLGQGFLTHPDNELLRHRLATGNLSAAGYHQQLLRLAFRLLFLFELEDRGLVPGLGASDLSGRQNAGDNVTAGVRAGRNVPVDLSEGVSPSGQQADRHLMSTDIGAEVGSEGILTALDPILCTYRSAKNPGAPASCRLGEPRKHDADSAHGDAGGTPALPGTPMAHAACPKYTVFGLDPAISTPELALTAPGGFLWSSSATADLNGCLLANECLVGAISHLTLAANNPACALDFRNVTPALLGSVYESLLALAPHVASKPWAFTLADTGKDRKSSGSYYTPDALVAWLIDVTLEPKINEILGAATAQTGCLAPEAREALEKQLLQLTVCDPTCGSGQFLLAAAHRIATHLACLSSSQVMPAHFGQCVGAAAAGAPVEAALPGTPVNTGSVGATPAGAPVNTGSARATPAGAPVNTGSARATLPGTPVDTGSVGAAREPPGFVGASQHVPTLLPDTTERPYNKPAPTAEQYRQALSDVITQCIYGVDRDAMAVELCKLNLWLQSPSAELLTALNRQIKCGDSLLGTTPAQDEPVNRQIKCGDSRLGTTPAQEPPADPERRGLAGNQGGQDARAPEELPLRRSPGSAGILPAPAKHVPSPQRLRRASCLTPKAPISSSFKKSHTRLMAAGLHDLLQQHAQKQFCWRIEFPDIFRLPGTGEQPENELSGWCGGFDVVLGNPPFGNAIESGTARSKEESRLYRTLYPQVARGAYDRANLFWYLSIALLLRPGGRYGLIMPRTSLSSRSALPLQEYINAVAPPEFLISPADSSLFAPAIVFVAAAAGAKIGRAGVRGEHNVLVSTDTDLSSPTYRSVPLALPWWSMLGGAPVVVYKASTSLAPLSRFLNIRAGCTTAVAYQLRDEVVDSQTGSGLKLITTGLIDRFTMKWGQSSARYLGQKWHHPRWPVAQEAKSPGVRKAIEAQSLPKVLVAGLVHRMEAVLDAGGDFGGVVQTFVLTPKDSSIDIRVICPLINSWVFSYEYLRQFGGKEVGGGSFWTIGKQELGSIPIPSLLFTSDAVIEQIIRLLDADGVPVAERPLQLYIASLYGLSSNEIEAIESWYG